MKKWILFLLIPLTCWVNASAATGNYWGRYAGDSTYQTQMIHLRPGGEADTVTWANVSGVDTLVALTNDSVGVHYFIWRFLLVSDSIWVTAVDIVNNISSGSEPATGSMDIKYETSLLDSLLYIHEYGGSYDSALYTNVYGIDSSIACEDLDVGLHNNVVLFWFDGDDRWRSSNEVFHNTYQVGIGSSSADKCQVYIDVQDITGSSNLRGIRFSGTLLRAGFGIVQDTCADKFIRELKAQAYTDSLGRATIELIKSKCINNGGKYKFEIYNPWTGERFTVVDSIPDSSSWRLPVSGW